MTDQPSPQQRVTVLLVATEWAPSKGGVSAFNQELGAALARGGHHVHCVVPRAAPEDVASARALGVAVHSAADKGVSNGAPFDIGVVPSIIVGHDRWSGPSAARWRDRYPSARLAHVLHVHPAQIEQFKTEAATHKRDERIRNAQTLARNADVVFAVGPLLAGWWGSDLSGVVVHEMCPGLPRLLEVVPSARAPHPQVVFLGRAEDAELKGVNLACEAMDVVARKRTEVEFVIRGIAKGTRDDFEIQVREKYRKPARLTPREFSDSRTEIAADLTTAWVVIQPSVEEAFGLVTLEALSLGTPVLVGSRSGVAKMLERVDPDASERVVVDSTDASAWAEAIERVLANPDGARGAVRSLAQAIELGFTWNGTAEELVARTLASTSRTTPTEARDVIAELRRASTPLRRIRWTIDGRWIPRSQESEVESWLDAPLADDAEPLLLLIGAPGTGKSALLAKILDWAETASMPVLGIKADFIPADVRTEDALRAHLQLAAPIVQTLREAVTLRGSALLVIDQLDALCEVVDTRTGRLHLLLQLLRDATAIDGVRVVASIRPFELRHEARVRSLQHRSRRVHLPDWTRAEVGASLPGAVLPAQLAPGLSTPHAADLLSELRAMDPAGFYFPGSVGELRERFWAANVEGDPERERAAREIAHALATSGALWATVPHATVSSAPVQALLRRGLLQSTEDKRVGFRHQTLFDLARSRALRESGKLVDFVVANQAQLEVRPLVRSTLMHLRSCDATSFNATVKALWDRSDLALHLRLLIVDTVADVDVPSAFECRLIGSAVHAPTTRRRALTSIARRPGWLGALDHRIETWVVEHADDALMLAVGFVNASPDTALRVLTDHWLPTDAGAMRCLNALAMVDRLGPEADDLVRALVPRVVAHPREWLYRLGAAAAKHSPQQAAAFYLACVDEEVRLALAGGEAGQDHCISEELRKITVPVDGLLDRVEAALLRLAAQPPDERKGRWYDRDETLRELAANLLGRLGREDVTRLFTRAASLPPHSPLEPMYLAALLALPGHVAARARWLVAEPSRLRRDPGSCNLLKAIASELDATQTHELDDVIDHVVRDRGRHDTTAAHRRSTDQWNRAYRLYMRSLLPQHHRSPTRLAADEAEQHQLPRRFVPNAGPRGGTVQSPMSKVQLERANNAAVLRALTLPDDQWRFSEEELPVGGGRQVLGELGRLARENPARVLSVAWDLAKSDRRDEARDLLHELAQPHEHLRDVERLALELFAAEGATLAVDDECARALRSIAKAIGMTDGTLAKLLARVESASGMVADATEEAVGKETRALFRVSFGGGVVPSGAFHWLEAIVAEFAHLRSADATVWSRAVRAALQADARPETWRLVLDVFADNWWVLGKSHAAELLLEIEKVVPHESVLRALARIYARGRDLLGPDAVAAFASRLIERDMLTCAGELAALAATDDSANWAWEALDRWRGRSDAARFANGVVACIGTLFGEGDRRVALARLGAQWTPAARGEDLHLVFTWDGEGWFADRPGTQLLTAVIDRIEVMDREALRSAVSFLERFVDDEPLLVLIAVERALDRSLASSDVGTQPVIGECLALTFSLRLALPDLAPRVHLLFERALQADVYAANEALETIDGRAGFGSDWLSMPLHVRSARVRRRGLRDTSD